MGDEPVLTVKPAFIDTGFPTQQRRVLYATILDVVISVDDTTPASPASPE